MEIVVNRKGEEVVLRITRGEVVIPGSEVGDVAENVARFPPLMKAEKTWRFSELKTGRDWLSFPTRILYGGSGFLYFSVRRRRLPEKRRPW